MREPNSDWLRVLAASAVVLLHVSSLLMVNPGPAHQTTWLVASFYNSLTRFAVPSFMLLSGYWLFAAVPRYASTKWSWVLLLSKRWARLALPVVVWHLVYLSQWHQPPAGQSALGYWTHLLLFDQPFEHLYYLAALLELIVLAPVIHWVLHRFPRHQPWVVAACFILPFLWPVNRWLVFVWVPWLGYFTAGAWWRLHQNVPISPGQLPKQRWWWGGWGVATLASWGMVVYQTLVTKATHNLAGFEYTHPLIILQTLSLTLALISNRNLPKLPIKINRLLPQLASLTLGVYLVHPLFVKNVTPILVSNPDQAWWLIPFTTVAVILASLLLTLLLKVCLPKQWQIV